MTQYIVNARELQKTFTRVEARYTEGYHIYNELWRLSSATHVEAIQDACKLIAGASFDAICVVLRCVESYDFKEPSGRFPGRWPGFIAILRESFKIHKKSRPGLYN